MRRWNNHLKTVVLIGSLSAVLIGIGGALGTGYLYGFTALAVLVNLGAYFFSDRLVLRMHGARPLGVEEAPSLHGIVTDLARSAGIPAPRLFLIDDHHANAFATGRNPEHGVVAVTTGILELLSPRELRGVLAHELAHIKNRDILVSSMAAALAGAVTYLAHALQFSAFFGASQSDEEPQGSPAAGLAMALVAPLAATVIQLAISRSREFLADETGSEISGDPLALASALQRLEHSAGLAPAEAQPATASLFIVNPLRGGLSRLFATHPSTEERIARLVALAGSHQRRVA